MCPEYPPFEQIDSNFDDIVKLHEIELGKTVKYADKLNDKCLKSVTIERSNVSLAVSVFHESTINGLEHYAERYPQFANTAKFLKIILWWWNRVNVRCKYTGERKREESKDYVSLVDEKDCKFLLQFADWLKFRNENVEKKNGLSTETFAAAH